MTEKSMTENGQDGLPIAARHREGALQAALDDERGVHQETRLRLQIALEQMQVRDVEIANLRQLVRQMEEQAGEPPVIEGNAERPAKH